MGSKADLSPETGPAPIAAPQASASRPLPDRAYFTVAVLTTMYIFSYVDRQLPNLLIEPIKHDLQLSDTAVSLLTGLSFALLYALAAVPLSVLADRWSRRGVIGCGVALWGTMTMVCGAAKTFPLFFAARMGVGLGEAALVPSSYSLIAEIFPPERRGKPMGIFVMGGAIGTGLAMLLGAGGLLLADAARLRFPDMIGDISSWRLVLAAVGLMTLMLAPLAIFMARPLATRRNNMSDPDAIRVRAVLGLMWRGRAGYAPILVGVPVLNAAIYGFTAWTPSFFIRNHGWSLSTAGYSVGIASIVGGVLGAIIGGMASDRLRQRSRAAPLYLMVAGTLLSCVFTVAINLIDVPLVQLVLTGGVVGLMHLMGTVAAVAIQDIAPDHARAQFSSIYLTVAGLVGIGLGPTLMAVMTDYVFRDEGAVGWSIAAVFLLASAASIAIILFNKNAFVKAAEARAA